MSELLVPELTMYWLGAAVLALAAAGFGAWAFQLDRRAREYGLGVAAAAGFLALGYVLMANDLLTVIDAAGNRMPFGRFVGYGFLFGIAVIILWMISGADRIWGFVLFAATYLWIGSVIVNWLTTGQTELLALAGIGFAFVTVIATMIGPLSTAAQGVRGERRLLFDKLRNLTVMVLVLYLVVSVVSDQGVGLLDTFVGVFVVVYLDVVFVAGIGIIVLRAETALTQVADDRAGDGGAGDDGGPDAPTDDGGDGPASATDDGVTIADPSASGAE